MSPHWNSLDLTEWERANMLSTQPLMFGEFDRAVAEAEFRAAVFFPLILLTIVLTTVNYWWALAITAVCVLPFQVFERSSRANMILVRWQQDGPRERHEAQQPNTLN